MRIEKASPVVFTPLEDGTGVLLNLETLFYYSLNRTGVALWQEIDAKKALTVDELVRAICDRFEISADLAGQEIEQFVARLQELKIIRVT